MKARSGRYIRIRSADGCHVFAASPRRSSAGSAAQTAPNVGVAAGWGQRTFVQLVLTRLGCVVTEIGVPRTPLSVAVLWAWHSAAD